MRQKKLAQRAASAALAACMMFTLSAPALAESTNALMQLSINSRSSIARLNEQNSIPEDAKTLNIADGDIEVSVSAEGVQTATQGGQTYTGVFVVTGTSTTNKLVIKGDSGTAANVYLKDLHITVSSGAAVSVSGDVDLYIEGSSVLQSGENCAGIQKEDDGQLTIDGSGSLEATGGQSGAGIGGAFHKSGNNITINGGKIIAQSTTGSGWGAGIGGGNEGNGNNITINGGDVTAIGGSEAAGIGGGIHASAENITINGGTVTAKAGGGAAAIGGGHANPDGGKATNINLVGGDITVQSNHGVATIGGVDGEITIPSTFGGSLTYLDANENKDATKTSIEKYGPVVNGKAVNSVNYADILGDGALSYDKNTNTLSLNDFYMGTLTINAPGTDIVLDGGTYSVLQGKLVIEAAADVTLTSTAPKAIFGDVNITCAGKLSITCENIAVDGNLTVNHASSVELIGKNNNGGTVNGAAVFNNTGEVTIQNKDATKGAAHSISYSGNYVYYTADGGALTDPRITPISTAANASYLHIVPSELHSIAVPEGCTFKVDGADLPNAHAGQTVTVTAPDKGDHFEFAGWTISPDSVTLTDADKLTATFTMPDGDVKLENSYNQLYDVTVLKGTATPSFAKEGTPITITADTIPGRKFERWDVLNDKVTLANKNSNTTTFNMPAGEVQVEAKYKALQSITVNDGTYTVNGETTTEAVKGDKIVATANPAPEGEKFAGWNVVGVDGLTDEQKAASPIEFDMPKNGVELTAQYKTLRNIVVNNGTYTVNGTDDKQAVEGDKINIKAAERPGYQFVRWEVVPDNVTITGVNNEEATFIMPNENVELKARYNKLYTITVDGGHADVTSALTGKEITVDADVPDGKKFMGWKADGITLTPAQQQSKHITFFMPEGNVTLTAMYKTLHTVTVINGTAQNGETTIKAVAGEKITLTPNLPDDQEFDCWYSGDINLNEEQRKTPELTFKMRDFDITIEAKSKQLYFVELADADTTANGESGKVEVKSGEDVTIVAPEREGWKFIRWEVGDNAHLDNATASEAHFTMPSGNVSVKAVYYEYHTITMTDDKGTAYNEKGEEITRAVQGDVITIKAKKDREDHEFNRWVITPDNGTLAGKNDPEATFTMPDEAVVVDAKYKHLQGITVNGGAAYYMDGTPVETAKAGETIVIVAEDRSKDGLRFAYWEVNSDKEVNVEGGEKATFEMVNAPVELTAHYEAQITYSNDPAIFDEGVGLHEDIVWEKVGDTASITAVLDNSTDEDDIGTFPGMTFDYWEIVTPENLNVTSGLNSETITFEVPECEVKLIAHWKDTTTVTPAEPLDPGFVVEPEAPADGSGAVIGVAAAGAAIWGGYEITTRVILNDLLPEGAAIPANRGELAMLIWTQKGKPEPAAEPAFTDVSDTELAKAAQWCVEQGLLTAEDGKFEPDGRTPKWRVIQVWNQAFPKG